MYNGLEYDTKAQTTKTKMKVWEGDVNRVRKKGEGYFEDCLSFSVIS